jgi:HAE1 family hydrophobic/amphiphilic exporter-1/multidrug efflux pump
MRSFAFLFLSRWPQYSYRLYLEGFVGRLFREFGVVIGAVVLISAFVSLTLTPMLNAYLMKGGEQKNQNFII